MTIGSGDEVTTGDLGECFGGVPEVSLIKVDARGSGRRASCTNEHNKGFQEVLLYPLKKIKPKYSFKAPKGRDFRLM